MTPAALTALVDSEAQRRIREAPPQYTSSAEILSWCYAQALAELLVDAPSGFDRSATLARAAEAKRAEGPPSL